MRKVLFRFTCVAQERVCVSSGIPLLFRQWRKERTREQKKQRGIEEEVGANSTERGFVRKNGQRRSFALSRPTLNSTLLFHSLTHFSLYLPHKRLGQATVKIISFSFSWALLKEKHNPTKNKRTNSTIPSCRHSGFVLKGKTVALLWLHF